MALQDSSDWLPYAAKPLRNSHLRHALVMAVVLHIVLLLALPDIPKILFPDIKYHSRITVFLKSNDKADTFQQSLNQPSLSATQQSLLEASPSSASVQKGEEEVVSEASPEVQSQYTNNSKADAAGKEVNNNIQPAVLFSYSLITRFAQQEAIQYAEKNPDQVDRFGRGFNSARNYQRRSRTRSYSNLYGDRYVRNNSSNGDICFVQQREAINNNDSPEKVVTFFRCDRKPQKLELNSKG